MPLQHRVPVVLLAGLSLFASLGKVSRASASDFSCDATYERNIRDIQKAKADTLHLVREAVFVDESKNIAEYAGIRLFLRTGIMKVALEVASEVKLVDIVGSLAAAIEYGGLIYAINEVDLGEYGNAYRLIVQAEDGGGRALEKFHAKLSKDNPKWRISESDFRQVILLLNHEGMFCTPVAGFTYQELTDYVQGMSDREADYWIDRATGVPLPEAPVQEPVAGAF